MKNNINLETLFQDAIEYDVSTFKLEKKEIQKNVSDPVDLFYGFKICFTTEGDQNEKKRDN